MIEIDDRYSRSLMVSCGWLHERRESLDQLVSKCGSASCVRRSFFKVLDRVGNQSGRYAVGVGSAGVSESLDLLASHFPL